MAHSRTFLSCILSNLVNSLLYNSCMGVCFRTSWCDLCSAKNFGHHQCGTYQFNKYLLCYQHYPLFLARSDVKEADIFSIFLCVHFCFVVPVVQIVVLSGRCFCESVFSLTVSIFDDELALLHPCLGHDNFKGHSQLWNRNDLNTTFLTWGKFTPTRSQL